jgi:hypothetical protein
MESGARRIIKNLKVLPELGNEQGNYYRKELPSGELYLVTVEINPIKDESYEFKDITAVLLCCSQKAESLIRISGC